MSETFRLYRHYHTPSPQGPAKDWAYRVTQTGDIEVRWGRAGDWPNGSCMAPNGTETCWQPPTRKAPRDISIAVSANWMTAAT